MKRQVLVATALVLCSIAFGAMDGVAQQIFNQFRQPTLEVGRPYNDIDVCTISRLNKQVLGPAQFTLPPTNVNDLDDGYSYIAFPPNFRFNFNGIAHQGIYVSVNGFAVFPASTGATKLVPAKQSAGLFTNSASFPDNVLAPFWGDHRYRVAADIAQGFMPSEISYVFDVDRDANCDTIRPARPCLVIQWKNLNINDQSVNSSVGNFQVRLYLASASENFQGNIEFAYGQVGGNPNTSNSTVVTRGATVGIKGDGGFPNGPSDFWNGLRWAPQTGANSRTDSTSIWQPSGGRSDAVIRFTAIVRFTFDMWGMGDADTSKGFGQRHNGMEQNRYVTVNDARTIMRSIVTMRPLDSVWRRQAYQGDVNHTGRFYFTKLNRAFSGDSIVNGSLVIWRRTIDVDQFTGKLVRRDLYEGDGLYGVGGRAPDVSNLSQIYYEVTEYDAAFIMRYLSARLPYLPWVRDDITTGPNFGKAGEINAANNVDFGKPVAIGNGMYRIPVYVNGLVNDVFGVRLVSDAAIEGVTPVNGETASVTVDNSSNVVVITGNGSFDRTMPVAYVTVSADEAVNFTQVRFNEVEQRDVRVQVVTKDAVETVSAFPNPTTGASAIAITMPNAGTVSVRVFDTYGNLVSTLFDGNANAGTLSLNWNGMTEAGSFVAPGAYAIRVDGDVKATQMITVVR
ncbi:MAG: T9SS type A sorting domain-containing protein [Candidatus Kapabacteria bacterium]|nr:T9SS type A sorting domain-containing protein [Candidatus Kapabacteria bacterium]